MAVQPLSCPGSKGNAVQLTNEFTTPAGIGHPRNTGECPIFIEALDGAGNSVKHVMLEPGQVLAWFSPPIGAASVWVVCSSLCTGLGELNYDTPVA
jgi:hypothetical protein